MSHDYSKSFDFNGDPEKAFAFAKGYFSGMDFSVNQISQNRLFLKSQGMFVNTKKNPLYGVGEMAITIQSPRVSIEADFNPLKKLIKIVWALSTFIDVLVLAIITALCWKENPMVIGIVAAAMAPTLVILPLVLAVQKGKISKTLDSFAGKMIAEAR